MTSLLLANFIELNHHKSPMHSLRPQTLHLGSRFSVRRLEQRQFESDVCIPKWLLTLNSPLKMATPPLSIMSFMAGLSAIGSVVDLKSKSGKLGPSLPLPGHPCSIPHLTACFICPNRKSGKMPYLLKCNKMSACQDCIEAAVSIRGHMR